MTNTDNIFATAPSKSQDEIEQVGAPRSAFNFSRMHYCNGIIGALMPIDVIKTLPNEDYEIGYDVVAKYRNPLVRQLKNGMRIYVHTYWCRNIDLWEGWKGYLDQGPHGNINRSVPKLCTHFQTSEGNRWTTLTPNSVANYMGIPFADRWRYDTTHGSTTPLRTTRPLYSFRPSKYIFADTNSSTQVSEEGDDTYDFYGDKNYYLYGEKDANGNECTRHLNLNALPFVAYNKICRDYYFDANVIQDNKNWYPDDEDHFKLPTTWTTDTSSQVIEDGSLVTCVDYTKPNYYDSKMYGVQNLFNNIQAQDAEYLDSSNYDYDENNGVLQCEVPRNSNNNVGDKAYLNVLHFRQWKGDAFTCGSPFKDMLRGDTPTVDVESLSDLVLDWTNAMATAGNTALYDVSVVSGNTIGAKNGNDVIDLAGNIQLQTALSKAEISGTATGSFNMNDIRKMAVLTTFRERLAKVNQSDYYNGVIQSQFGYNPHAENGKPTYIGGFYQDVVNESVTNQTASDDYMLGETSGRGISANSGYIGKFHSTDHGYLITIMSIVPDAIYKRSLDRMWTTTEYQQEYFPLLANLEPQQTLNKEVEIYNGCDDGTIDNTVFNYTDRYQEYKSRRNIVTGLAENNNEVFDRSQFLLRSRADIGGNNVPYFNSYFKTLHPDNIDHTPFYTANEPEFDLEIACKIDKVSPIPYECKPMDLI